ncbi:hypothetical protein GALL_153070 [mine drainage metagenome]|uniref:Uncharacterized protein n=1 Tax=mine drainage metagenome TaxID=410659 RepID=A0A1J5S2G7_9ZZZZ
MFQTMRRLDEAYRLINGLPGKRQFPNADLAEPMKAIAQAARVSGTPLSDEERYGVPLSAPEQEIAGTKMMPFCVTVTQGTEAPEQLRVLAPSSVDAVTMALEIMFPDFCGPQPKAWLKVAVELVKS